MAAPAFAQEPKWPGAQDECDEFVGYIDGCDVYWCHDWNQWVVRRGSEPENYLSCRSLRLSELMP